MSNKKDYSAWEEIVTDDGHVCFVNKETKAAQWTHPRTGSVKQVPIDMPAGWEKTYDEEKKCTTFHNTKTNETTSVDPRLAFAVEESPMDVTKLPKRFSSCTTAMQVLEGKDLTGRLALITGANCGIGYETARALVLHGCEVIFASRNRASTEEAIENIVKEKPEVRVLCRFIPLDLAKFESVTQFVNEIKRSVHHIDYLILNAGLWGPPEPVTVDGLETTFQVCHLSHFYLTLQLEELLDYTSRVVVVSSEAHRLANLPAEDLTEKNLSPPREKINSATAYGNAKLCNILFAKELGDRWTDRGIAVFSLHPGAVRSQFLRNSFFFRMVMGIGRPLTKSQEQGAATSVYCATAKELTGLTGWYFSDCHIAKPTKLAQNETLRKALWTISENIVERLKSGETNNDK